MEQATAFWHRTASCCFYYFKHMECPPLGLFHAWQDIVMLLATHQIMTFRYLTTALSLTQCTTLKLADLLDEVILTFWNDFLFSNWNVWLLFMATLHIILSGGLLASCRCGQAKPMTRTDRMLFAEARVWWSVRTCCTFSFTFSFCWTSFCMRTSYYFSVVELRWYSSQYKLLF